MLDFMEKVVFEDPVTDFLNDYGFHRGNMIGGQFTGKVIREIISPRKLKILSDYLGSGATIYVEYLHSLRELYSIVVDKRLHLDLASEKVDNFKKCFKIV